MVEITLAIAALAGLGSFVAPCILPMIPAFLAYISGATLSELNQRKDSKTITINRTKIILNSVFLF
jgi:Cytochrome C biogenesis protein transmembrane region.